MLRLDAEQRTQIQRDRQGCMRRTSRELRRPIDGRARPLIPFVLFLGVLADRAVPSFLITLIL
jgi:hypothetical protein